MICDEEFNAALVRELCSGRLLMEAKQKVREQAASAEARAMKDAQSTLGKPVGAIPQHEYFLIGNKYGMECWDDREFVRDFFKRESHLKAGDI